MEHISETLKQLINTDSFKKRYNQIKSDVLNDKDIQNFIQSNSDIIDDGLIERSLGTLYEYTTQSQACNNCESLDKCENVIQGYVPELVMQAKSIELIYSRCSKKILEDENRKLRSLVKSMHMPKDVLEASISNIDYGIEGRSEAVGSMLDTLQKSRDNKLTKGLYLYGPFGTGKTYILGAIANELASRGKQTLIVYLPEFLRELKSSINDNSLEEKLEMAKKVDVLMLDDIGAESVSSFTRDEIIGAILQYRMLQQLPTFFTSNFDLKQLEHHLAVSQRGEEEFAKAKRIIERIKSTSTPVMVKGKNFRET
ncbi:MAG: primosomal protein DnaI [Bacillales bacterium]|nr:primosomal protein DnaI [Bacillales bacterium]